MKEGTFIRCFTAKDGRDVTLRAPRWSDLDDMLEFINSLVEERAEIARDRKLTRDEEAEWLGRHLAAVETDRKAVVAVEVGGRFVGQVEILPEGGYSRHVGQIAIGIRCGYRDIGIGTELMKEAERQARRLELELLTLEVNATNDRARHVYEKVGFQVVGRVPKATKMSGTYIDHIIMAKEL